MRKLERMGWVGQHAPIQPPLNQGQPPTAIPHDFTRTALCSLLELPLSGFMESYGAWLPSCGRWRERWGQSMPSSLRPQSPYHAPLGL